MTTAPAFAVDAVGNPEPIIAYSDCTEITIGEIGGGTTSDWILRSPLMNSPAARMPAGTVRTIRASSQQGPFSAGAIVGYVELLSGSTTFFQIEDRR